MSPTPPFLAIRPDISFWVEDWTDGHSSSTLQALKEGCYRDLLFYDSAGILWPVLEARPVNAPGLLDRLLPWRRIKVATVLGDGAPTRVGEVAGRLRAILEADHGFEWHRGPTRPELIAHFEAAQSAADLIEVAREID